MTRRIAMCLLLAVGCASEPSETRHDAPASSPAETKGAELPVPPHDVASDPPLAEPTALLDWGFEPASADCNGWAVVGADAIRAVPAHTGAYSCKVCSNGSDAGLGLKRELGSVPAGRYALSAWVRKRTQNLAPGEAIARIDVEERQGARIVATPIVSVRDEWDRLETTIELDHGASNLRLTIGSDSAQADRCLFVDDVSLIRLP